MGKLNYKPRVLDDEFVKDGLCAIGQLERSPMARDLYFVVGGIATQSYLPTSCRRATSDIDLAILRPLSNQEFRDFSKESATFLADQGYAVEAKKGQNSYYLTFAKGDDALVLGFARRSPANFERIKGRLEREMHNVRKKIVEGRSVTYPVSSPEDIAVPKLVRSVGSLLRNPDFLPARESVSYTPLDEQEIARNLVELSELREELSIHPADPTLAERLRFNSDIFDVRLLSEIVGFNDSYFNQAAHEWNVLVNNPQQRDQLYSHLLPQLTFS